MENDEKPRCGVCRMWFPTGATDGEGLRLGYCDEFPMAGLINENCCCEGKVTPFKRREVRDGK